MAALPRPSERPSSSGAIPPRPPDVDQRVILSGISWRDYCVLRDLLDSPGVRMTYLQGTLEIMSPSRLHEDVKKRIARLLELYAIERDIPLQGYGSTTFRHEPRERGLEPDECYVVGKPQSEGFPELAIEVSVTSGGIDKLEVYRGLGVREVWLWVDGSLDSRIRAATAKRGHRRRRSRHPGSLCQRAGSARGAHGVSHGPSRR